ncbi:group I truncated hemoglobin [Pseudemcibacter aquimaris]|uniref:group I truncated hemoglobin n=1 Tax=Pseudemcibacter aquimaris TaxID=2857064 RepID=UPI002012E4CB|nr:group 1 truncated hemoglobin [Pseudemcibacter aquimaris]MCC3861061.1 group 1 truncated hemoglobin [Pseudemcibacter aquimaris]WDU59879.1 group 1 truncated hemoglobin [Pseudemcibacter aquimaris]
MSSLYERIGGDAAVEAAVDVFYKKVLTDDSISQFFETTDMDAQREKQKKFLTVAFGGPNDYSGKDMRAAHAHLTLTEDHFGAVAGHLQATLEELGVPEAEIGEAMAIAASTHDDVLGL